jgi:hypothetical protein
MSVNRHRPHVLVLPEDDANRQLANGFLLHSSLSNQIQVLPEAGGWLKVLGQFQSDYVTGMMRFPGRFMVLLIDFDGQPDRLDRARREIPGHLKDRVFILGVWSEPESLKASLGRQSESIGLAIAEDCHKNTASIWSHELLRHNAAEMERLQPAVRPILFP